MHASRHGGGLLERLKEIRGERQEFHGGKHQRSLPGTVVSFDGTTLVLTKGVKTYTVTTTDTTKFVDRKWQAIDKTTIVAGHKVTLKGTVNGLNVDATMVRDVSLPTKTTSPETAS